MPYSLKGRNVLVTGGSRGLGALISQKFAAEGCNIAVNYLSSADAAHEVAASVEKAGRKSCIIQGDVGLLADCQRIVQESIKELGGLDIIVSNAGWTRFSTFADLSSTTEEDWDKCWAVNTKAQLHLLREALPTFNANPDGGVFLISSSIAGTAASGSSMPYSVTKAAGLHLMQCLAQTQGPKIRVNAVLPGLLLTEWGKLYSQEHIDGLKERAALKMVTDLDDCADAYIAVAKNASMTGEKIRVDGGLLIR